MKVRKLTLDLNECSEVRVLISRKLEDLRKKCSQFSDSNDPCDKQLFSYWHEKLCTLKTVYSKLCRSSIEVVL